MVLALTDDQRAEVAAAGGPVEFRDPRSDRRFRLVPADEYEALVDRLDQETLRRVAARSAARRLAEGG